MITLSVVVPVYRSQDSLPELIDALAAELPKFTSAFEVILVNDSSPDDSWRVIEVLTAQHGWVHGINLMRNYGQHNALLCGIRAAQYEFIATIDDDLQHPPAVLKDMAAHLIENNADVVYGAPEAEQHGFLRDMASQVTKWVIQSSMGVKSARKVSALRVFRTQLRDAFGSYRSPYVSIDVLLTWGTTRFSHITVPHVPRKYGESNYTLRKLITHALNMITGFSVLPLQISSILGFVLAVFGLLILVYVIGRYIIDGGVVPGFPFLASIIAIFSGAQLFALGIIGEYIARIYFRTMERPPYTVRGTSTTAETATSDEN
jgi:glycosyltransferase involved in cell wall biosynthesis